MEFSHGTEEGETPASVRDGSAGNRQGMGKKRKVHLLSGPGLVGMRGGDRGCLCDGKGEEEELTVCPEYRRVGVGMKSVGYIRPRARRGAISTAILGCSFRKIWRRGYFLRFSLDASVGPKLSATGPSEARQDNLRVALGSGMK